MVKSYQPGCSLLVVLYNWNLTSLCCLCEAMTCRYPSNFFKQKLRALSMLETTAHFKGHNLSPFIKQEAINFNGKSSQYIMVMVVVVFQLYELLEENEVAHRTAGNILFTCQENPSRWGSGKQNPFHCKRQNKSKTTSQDWTCARSVGHDDMNPRVLKEQPNVVAKTLSIIFEKSWLSDAVPKDCKEGNILPIFNKDRSQVLGNYRPVSQLSSCRTNNR